MSDRTGSYLGNKGLEYYRAYPRDFFEGSVGMRGPLKGFYRMVIDLIYMHDGILLNDYNHISGNTGFGKTQCKRMMAELVEMGKIQVWTENERYFTQKRAENELKTSRKFQENQANKIAKRWKNKGLSEGPVIPEAIPPQDHKTTRRDDASHLCDFGMLNIFSGDLEKKSEPHKKNKTTAKKGTRLKENWFLPKDWGEWAIEYGLTYNQIEHEADTFRDYWLGKAGAAGVKLDWLATWRNWIRRNHNKSKRQGNGQSTNGTNGNGNYGSNPANGRGMAGSSAANEIASRATKWADKKEAGGGTDFNP